MSRIALLGSEPLRSTMAGIGIRYWELAHRLDREGIDVVLITAGKADEVPPTHLTLRSFVRGEMAALLADCDGAITQGQLANDILLECPNLPVAIDLYDPWLVENLHYASTLGYGPFENDHATWLLQMGRGDFFLCSSEEQRLFYLGFLTALGRVHPDRIPRDADLIQLIQPVPFGLPEELPPAQLLLEHSDRFRILFGGLYDWYDPWTLLKALERLSFDHWSLLLIRNPNPGSTPQRLMAEVEAYGRRQGWWEEKVELLDWMPADRRWDLLREVDVLCAPHRLSFETRLSLRTRYLDALAVGCPVVVTEGGAISRMVRSKEAGWVIPEGDSVALAAALEDIHRGARRVFSKVEKGKALARDFAWSKVLQPLLTFCRNPQKDRSREKFSTELVSVRAPSDDLGGKIKRRLRGLARLAKRGDS